MHKSRSQESLIRTEPTKHRGQADRPLQQHTNQIGPKSIKRRGIIIFLIPFNRSRVLKLFVCKKNRKNEVGEESDLKKEEKAKFFRFSGGGAATFGRLTTAGNPTLPCRNLQNSRRPSKAHQKTHQKEEQGRRERRESLREEGSEEREMDIRNEGKWVIHPIYTPYRTDPYLTGSTQPSPKPRPCKPIQQGPFYFSPFIFFACYLTPLGLLSTPHLHAFYFISYAFYFHSMLFCGISYFLFLSLFHAF